MPKTKKIYISISVPKAHDIGVGQWTPSLFYTRLPESENILRGKNPISYPTSQIAKVLKLYTPRRLVAHSWKGLNIHANLKSQKPYSLVFSKVPSTYFYIVKTQSPFRFLWDGNLL